MPLSDNAVPKEKQVSVLALMYGPKIASSRVADLLSANLSAVSHIELIERSEIERVINEQMISAAFSASAVSNRIEVGHILKTDLLAFIDFPDANTESCRIMVSETHTGIRRYNELVTFSGDLDMDVKSLETKITKAVVACRQPVRAICAVPPFVCSDLSLEHASLKNSYAHLAESELMSMKGVAVVEFEEAQAISLELMLAGKNNTASRALPFYFLGEYRIDNINPAKPPFIKIVLKQGSKEVETRYLKNISEDAGAEFVGQAVSSLAIAHLGQKKQKRDIAKEMSILRNRAKQLWQQGQFQEATELAEAFLLLEPHDIEMRKIAFISYGRMAMHLTVKNGVYTTERDRLRKSMKYSQMGFRHLEVYLGTVKPDEMPESICNLMSECGLPAQGGVVRSENPELIRELLKIREEYRDLCMRVIEYRYGNRTLTYHFMGSLMHPCIFYRDKFDETLQDSLHSRLALASLVLGKKSEFHDRLKQQYIKELLSDGLGDREKNTPLYAEFLTKVSSLKNPIGRQLAEAGRKAIELRRHAKPPQPIKYTPPKIEEQTADAQSERVTFREVKSLGLPSDFKIMDMMKCGENIDVIWGFNGPRRIYLMKEKGKPEEIFTTSNQHSLWGCAYDGRFLWVPVSGPDCSVLVINPDTGKITQFTEEDGLPEFISGTCAAFKKGEVGLVGMFGEYGSMRTYTAVLTLGPHGSKHISIVHEAVHSFAQDKPAREYRKDPQLCFYPKFAITGIDPTDRKQKILIGRALPDHWGLDPSLLVDPAASSARLVKANVDSHIISSDVWREEDAIYWIARDCIKRLSINHVDSEIVCKTPAKGRILYYNNAWHIAGKKWLRSEKIDGEYSDLNANFPRRYAYGHYYISAHYGLLLKPQRSGQGIYQVRFDDIND